jgi:hypothetical protein
MNFAAAFVWRGEAGQARFDGSCRRGGERGLVLVEMRLSLSSVLWREVAMARLL